MMDSTKIFAKAEGVRIQITKQQEIQIRKMYKSLAEDIDKEAKALSYRTNISSIMRIEYLKDLNKQVTSQINKNGQDQKSMIVTNLTKAAESVVKDNSAYLSSIGLNVKGAFSYIPQDVVQQLSSGKLYEGKWSLSSAI